MFDRKLLKINFKMELDSKRFQKESKDSKGFKNISKIFYIP